MLTSMQPPYKKKKLHDFIRLKSEIPTLFLGKNIGILQHLFSTLFIL